ncbi:MAG TPA: serine/threonine-protein kinase [Kofleriaceae bacterium]|nr:serine/threonine-protein kinase [Kofleriaceae bacterium]
MPLVPGQAFGNYRILAQIGVGGMGMVFLAEHPHIGKKVALKIIHRELAGNREVVSRFLNEARAVNAIGNEHIVEIHDFGQTDDGEHFFIMEYLEGRTLAQSLQQSGVVSVPRALHIGAQMASGLGAAHDRAIIHRDLKPDNVMLVDRLGDKDFVKLLDFGLAKFLAELDARKLTAAGVVLGTPQYMSPEACESRAGLDHRCDIYSLGILLFQMLVGQVPFTGESMGEILGKQVAQPPPALRGINPDIPPAVEQVVLRCLAKDPNVRFQHMLQLRDALLDPNAYLASRPPVIPVAMTKPRVAQAPPRKRSVAPSEAPTMYETDPQRLSGMGDRMVPVPVPNQTMEIGTPYGHVNRPPRRVWPAALLISAIAVSALAVVVAVAASSESGDAAAAPTAAAGDGGVAAVAAPRTARITLTTRPAGASVYDGAGLHKGMTPLVLEMPIDGREVTLVFRHPDAVERTKKFVPSGDTTLEVELPAETRAAAPDAGATRPAARDRRKDRARKVRTGKDGLMRPDL